MGKRLNSSNLQDNEILKTTDLNDAFDAQITNIASAFQALLEPDNDFIIGSQNLVEFHSESDNDWALNIGPVMGVSQKTGQIFIEPEKSIAICSVPQTNGYSRIDTVEIRGVYKKTDTEQRAFIDFDTKLKTIGYVETNRELQIEARVVNNGAASVIAPNHTSGWVKIAEIFVPEDATKISDCTIYNITADISGLENENWTNQKTSTYNVNYISDINRRVRNEHNFDGTHKAAVIHIKQIDTGIGSGQVNGNNLPVGGTNIVSGQEISATESIYKTLRVFAEKINDIYKEYLKNGKYNFDRELILKGDDSKEYETPLKIGVNTNGFYVKRGDIALINVLPDGKIRVYNEYVAENEMDLVNKKVTNQLNNYIDSVEKRVKIIERDLDQSEYNNELLSRYTINSLEILAATTGNIELNGPQTVDGIDCGDDSVILVKNQTNAAENGLYKVTSKETGWERLTEFSTPNSLRGNLFIIKNGSNNKNKIFYCPTENFIDGEAFGTDSIKFSVYFGSISPTKNTIVQRDENGHVKASNSTSANDCVTRGELYTKYGAMAKAIIDYIYPVGSVYITAKEENPNDIFGVGSWKKIEGRFIMGSDGNHPNGSSGGNEYINLTVKQIPSHNHTFTGASGTTGNNNVGHTHSFTPGGTIRIKSNPSFAGNEISGKFTNQDNATNATGCFTYSATYKGWNPFGGEDSSAMDVLFAATPSGSIYGGEYTFEGSTGSTAGQSANHIHTFTPSGSIGNTGSGEAIDIKPPYTVKNIWERIA